MADIKAQYLACPIRHVVSRFGDKWSMLVLYMLYKSETGVLRFNEIRKLMSDCSQKMLSQTLKNLEQSHLVPFTHAGAYGSNSLGTAAFQGCGDGLR